MFSLSEQREVFGNRNILAVSSATFAEFIMSSGVIFTVFHVTSTSSSVCH
ncbi:MAG: hypothetical protein ACETVY_05715 [Candidatus Bathyarchaeia archaeon]